METVVLAVVKSETQASKRYFTCVYPKSMEGRENLENVKTNVPISFTSLKSP